MGSVFGSSIRGYVLILLVAGLRSSSDEQFASAAGVENGQFATVSLSSLLEEADIGSSSGHMVYGLNKRGAVLEVVHNKNLDPSEMLRRDEGRVMWLQSKMIPLHQNDEMKSVVMASSAVSSPVIAGYNIGTGNYLLNVSLGTRNRTLQLMMDTGSALMWTQCQPCSGSCYNQDDPIFDPSASSTYSNIPCPSSTCSSLYRGNPPSCTSNGACRYFITYGDGSYTNGPLAMDTLTLTPSVNLPKYVFGCGQNNSGFVGADGLLGLSNDGTFSMVAQGASRFGKYFSYCLPSTTNTAGFLALGNANSTGFSFTSINTVPQNSEFYGIKITEISVGGVTLSTSSSRNLTNSNSIIDSGTVITRLPSPVYSEVRSAFRKKMAQYPRVSGVGLLDTCYDFSKYSSITYPNIVISFSGGLNVGLNYRGIFFVISRSQVCLAFATPNSGSSLVIYGNVQQRTFEVAYDVANKKLGFKANSCS